MFLCNRSLRVFAASFCLVAFYATTANAVVSWKRVGTVTTLNNQQMCYTDGSNVVCDSNAPTLSGSSLGIGSTSPVNALDIGTTTFGIHLNPGTPANTNYALYNNGGTLTWNGTALGGLSGGTANYVPLWTGAASLGTSNIYQSGSNVGIGTTVPGAALQVSSAGSGSVPQLRLNDTSAYPRLTFSKSGVDDWIIGGNDANFNIWTNFGYFNVITALHSGNVGIGTGSPQSTLSVNGGVAIGSSYAGVTAAPTNGLAVSGSVGVGTTSPATGAKADIAGPVKIAGTGSETCTASQVGMVRYNSSAQYFELCSYP